MVKQYSVLWPHLATIAEAPELFEEAMLAALWHDLGKAAAGFQAILRGRKDKAARSWNNYRHEILSGALVAALAPATNSRDLLLAVLTHHLGLNKGSLGERALYRFSANEDTTISFSERLEQLRPYWGELQDILHQLESYALESSTLPWPSLPPEPTALPDPFAILQNKMEQNSTQSRNRSRRQPPSLSLKQVYLRGLLVSADHMASAAASESPGDRRPAVVAFPRPAKLTVDAFGFSLHRHQVESAKRGSMLLTAPTGSGKTEAALLWAEANQDKQRSRHIFYILPYTASINAMYKRLRHLLGEDSVSLLHGRSSYFLYRWLCEAGEITFPAIAQARRLRQQTKELYYPVKVLTPHQILMAFLGWKGWEKAWCEYSGGLFILDEIHAYEPQLMGLLFEMLRQLTRRLRARVFVMSATMPSLLSDKLRTYIGKSHFVGLGREERDRYSRHRVHLRSGSLKDQLPDIINRLRSKQRVLVVLNTVDGAIEAFKQLATHSQNPCLVHGRLTSRDRQVAEQRLHKRGDLEVDLLVGTQAIEVSLNVDFDVLFTDPAPLDALLQRFGRVNRKPLRILERLADRERFKELIVCEEQWPHTWHIYENTELGLQLVKHSLSVLPQNDVLQEGSIQQLIDEVYGTSQLGPFLKIADEKARRLSELITQLNPGDESDRHEVDLLDSMIDAITVIPIQFKKEHELLLHEHMWFDAQDYALQISRGRYIALQRNGQIHKENKHLYGLFYYDPGIGPDFERRMEREPTFF